MTDREKKMKRYTTAVERRLRLPKEIRSRVMCDFISSITARREAGMTDEEIFAELGNPKQAALELNEQMKEFTYRKSPWRFLGMALAIYAGYQLLTEGIAWVAVRKILHQNAAAVGIIGGADGPTAVFVTATVPTGSGVLLMAACLALGIWVYRRLCQCRKK